MIIYLTENFPNCLSTNSLKGNKDRLRAVKAVIRILSLGMMEVVDMATGEALNVEDSLLKEFLNLAKIQLRI